MTIKGVFFTDLDGTLEDSRQDMVSSVLAVRRDLGLPSVPGAHFEPHVIKGMDHLYRRCFSESWPSSPTQEQDSQIVKLVEEKFLRQYLDHVVINTKVYPGISELLYRLKEKEWAVVVVTNKPSLHSEALLEKVQLSSLITKVMGGDSCEATKPDPLPLKLAYQFLNLNPATTPSRMMGDSLADIQVARAFGAVPLWAGWGYCFECPSPESDVFHLKQPLEALNGL